MHTVIYDYQQIELAAFSGQCATKVMACFWHHGLIYACTALVLEAVHWTGSICCHSGGMMCRLCGSKYQKIPRSVSQAQNSPEPGEALLYYFICVSIDAIIKCNLECYSSILNKHKEANKQNLQLYWPHSYCNWFYPGYTYPFCYITWEKRLCNFCTCSVKKRLGTARVSPR